MRIANDANALAAFVGGFFSPLAELFADASVSEVLVNGPHQVFVERGGRLQRTEAHFDSEAILVSALRAVSQYLGRPLDEQHPILEGRLPDGSRLQAVLPPLVSGGPCVAIRRHRIEQLSWEQLVSWGAISEEAVLALDGYVKEKRNILVSGGTGSGKTSLLRCVAGLTPPDERVVTIEDARELFLPLSHVVSLEARPSVDGRGGVSIRDLFMATLRLRPDRIVIGELRGGEALDLVQAMTSGHGGCLSTIHASSPEDAVRRLETLCLLSGVELPLSALRAQIGSALDVIIQVERRSDGRRWVSRIAEVRENTGPTGHVMQRIFERAPGEGDLQRLDVR